MKRLIVIAEGKSEESFVRKILLPYLCERCDNVGFTPINIGGVSKYSKVKGDLIRFVYQPNTVVTTMIDFYGLHTDFPGMKDPAKTHLDKVRLIEKQIKEDIEKTQNRTFSNLFPYIQLHEFEALIFSSPRGIKELFEPDRVDMKEFLKIVKNSDPEEIDNKPESSPSTRLKKIIRGYDKVIDGVNILETAGIDGILARCPHFREWVETLTKALKRP